MTQRLNEALVYMQKAHEGQTRWDGITPYEVHPIKVVNILQDLGVKDEVVLSAGYLHDVIEDTTISRLDIKRQFGEAVADLVDELTFATGKSDQYYHLTCLELSHDAKMIKLADILANISDKGKHSEHFLQKRTTALVLMLSRLLKIYG